MSDFLHIAYLNPPQHYYEISYLYTATGQKLHKATHINFSPATTTDYVGSFIYEDDVLQTILTAEGRVVVDGSTYAYQYFLKDHLGNTRITFNESGTIIQEDSYYPYGMNMAGLSHCSSEDLPNKYLYNGKELQDDFGLGWYDYGARFYDAAIGRWHVVDPMAESYYAWSPYNYVRGNPIARFDPIGMWDDEFNDRSRDWVEAANGNIYWDNNATSQESTKSGEKYLGKNVLVGTHNRNRDGNEEINSARFDLYLETNKTGSSATIYGNTVPGDITKYGTLAEGLFSARFQGRASKIAKGIDDLALIINEVNDLPTTNGNPNKANSDMLSEVFFHAGNYGSERLTYATKDGGVGYLSKGCQTSGCGAGTRPIHNSFMGEVGRNFTGFYYLRSKPNPFAMPAFVMPVDNTYVAPIFHLNF
jgi:RHS repeat-associated protein